MENRNNRKFWWLMKWGVIIASLITLLLILIDSFYYCKFVIAPLNIILYNVFTSHGANLYGTEPPSFYLINGILNFNLAFLLALFSLPLYLLVSIKFFFLLLSLSFLMFQFSSLLNITLISLENFFRTSLGLFSSFYLMQILFHLI